MRAESPAAAALDGPAREGTRADRRIGAFAAFAVFAIGLAYALTGAIGLLSTGGGREHFGQVDPALAILEGLIVLCVPFMVLTMAAVHACAPRGRRACSAAALAFMALLAGVTGSIHFVTLTVVRRLDAPTAARLSPILSFRWPSVFFALDLLAWDVFLGLSLVLAASVFRGGGAERRVRITLAAAGTLCLTGTLGPLLGELRLQVVAILGYAFVFPVACLLLGLSFRRTASAADGVVISAPPP